MKNLVRFDWAVKRLLRNKAGYVILEGFLSELLGDDIRIEQVLESEGNRETADNKTNIVDILVQNSKNEYIIIEVQNDYMQDYLLRMLYGTTKIISNNLIKGMSYDKIKKVISINIVYFDLGQGEDYIYHGTTNYVGLHKKDILKLTVDEEKIYHTIDIAKIYPEYYIIRVNHFNDISTDTLDEWVNFFKNEEVKDDTKAKGLKEAIEELNIMKLNTQERNEYESYITEWRDNYSKLVGNYNKGKFEGELEGEKKEKIKLIKNMLSEGMSISLIAKIADVSEEYIKNLGL